MLACSVVAGSQLPPDLRARCSGGGVLPLPGPRALLYPEAMIKLSPRVFALLFALLLFGACSSTSSDDVRAAAGDDTDETAEEDAESSDGDAEGDDTVKDYLVEAGFSEDGADCIIESLEDQDVDVDSLSEDDVSSGFGDLADAFGQAGADCVDEVSGDLENLPEEAFDLSNPVVYDQFVKQFSAGSGLSEEVSQCVADYLVDNDVDVSSFLSNPTNPDGEAAAAVQTAVQDCQ